jgi:Holliday junction resolvase RusA-like endonuclease
LSILKITIKSCPPGINATYGVNTQSHKKVYKSDQAVAWQNGAALIIGSEAGKQDWKDDSKYYEIEIIFQHPRLDVDAPVKLVIDTVATKLGFNDGRIIKQSSEKIIGDFEQVEIILRGREELKLSFSRIDLYSRCPQLWYNTYIKHITTPQSPEAAYGVKIHNALKEYWETGLEGAYKTLSDLSNFASPHNSTYIAQKLIREGLEGLRELSVRIDKPLPELHIDYPDFQGYFDLLIDDTIIDYKVVNSYYDLHKLITSEQLTCYAWLHYRQFGYLPRAIAFVNLNKWTGQRYVLSTTRTLEDIQVWEEKVKAVRSAMEKQIHYKEPKGCFITKDIKCYFYIECWNPSQDIYLSQLLPNLS